MDTSQVNTATYSVWSDNNSWMPKIHMLVRHLFQQLVMVSSQKTEHVNFIISPLARY
jgi:hypothetical protein